MRCNKCRVDLEDHHKNCPLCRDKAVVSKQQIVLNTAPYPEPKSQINEK